jgi:hypothetical protein
MFPHTPIAASGDNYLVDLGRLVPVAAVSAKEAFLLATTSVFGAMPEVPFEHPMVYQIDDAGELVLAVFD